MTTDTQSLINQNIPETPQNKNERKFSLTVILIIVIVILSTVVSVLLYQKTVQKAPLAEQITQASPSPTPVEVAIDKVKLRTSYAHNCVNSNSIWLKDPLHSNWEITIDTDCEFFLKIPSGYTQTLNFYTTELDKSAGTFQFFSDQLFQDLVKLPKGREIKVNERLQPDPVKVFKGDTLVLNDNEALEILVEGFPQDGFSPEESPCMRSVIVKRNAPAVEKTSYIELSDGQVDGPYTSCLEYLSNRRKNAFDQVIKTFQFLDQRPPIKYPDYYSVDSKPNME